MLYKLFGGLVGAFLWLCRVPASTLMLMGGNASGMVSSVEAACMMLHGACYLSPPSVAVSPVSISKETNSVFSSASAFIISSLMVSNFVLSKTS